MAHLFKADFVSKNSSYLATVYMLCQTLCVIMTNMYILNGYNKPYF